MKKLVIIALIVVALSACGGATKFCPNVLCKHPSAEGFEAAKAVCMPEAQSVNVATPGVAGIFAGVERYKACMARYGWVPCKK